jgi:hypothetical protein
MSKEQWGHGFRMGAKKAKDKNSLINKWFLSFTENEKIEWQGRILLKEGDSFLIQLYSWFDGGPTDQIFVSFEDMKNWKFYDSDFDMRYASAMCKGVPEREFYNNERVFHGD